ncbi:MAG: FAD-dependent oxidoreductase, partial [Gemmatimonadaceae bacterium]
MTAPLPTSVPVSAHAHRARLGRESFDVVVIGGGINGCGIARDAVMRGLSVALIEQDDFGSGTSSRT